MVQHIKASNPSENRYQQLRKTDSHLRAEIKISKDDLGYQFKLRHINEQQGCFFVNQNSSVLKLLDIGSVLDMKYWTAGKTRIVKYVSAEVKDIRKQNQEPFKGHYKVGLSILKANGLKRVDPIGELMRVRADMKGAIRAKQAYGCKKPAFQHPLGCP